MIRSFRVAAAIAAISLASCGPKLEEPATPYNTSSESPSSERDISFNADSNVSVATFRDSTGCEWLIFRYRGYGISTEPRTEIYGTTDARRQVCVPAARK